MGLIGRILGAPGAVSAIGGTVRDVSEVFTANATRKMELSAEAQAAALDQFAAEFAAPHEGPFDRFVNGLNRLPRPMLAFGTLGFFAYAVVDPPGFGARMTALQQVPEPLWWLLGAIVSFYFGAREAFHYRARPTASPKGLAPAAEDNAAVDDWRRTEG